MVKRQALHDLFAMSKLAYIWLLWTLIQDNGVLQIGIMHKYPENDRWVPSALDTINGSIEL